MGSDRVQVDAKNSSTLTPGFKPEESSFLKQRYQDQVEEETIPSTAEKQLSTSGQPTPTPPPSDPTPVSHSFGRVSVRPIQAKLKIGQPNDKYEQEADRVAEQVMRMPDPRSPAAAITRPVRYPVVQRMCSDCEEELQRQPLEEGEDEEKMMQAKAIAGWTTPVIQRQGVESEEEDKDTLQMKPLVSQITPLIQRQSESSKEEDEETVQTKPLSHLVSPLVQRQGEAGEEEEEEILQTKPLVGRITPLIQRMVEPTEEDEENLQTKPLTRQFPPLVQRISEPTDEEQEEEEQIVRTKENPGQTPSVTSNLEAQLNTSKGSGQPLPEETRSFMESRFGHDLSQVRVHADGRAVQLNQELKAKAFTHGQDVFFGTGNYRPESGEGKRLLAHELTHIIQQNRQTPDIQRAPLGKRSDDPAFKDEEIAPAVPRSNTRSGIIEELRIWLDEDIKNNRLSEADAKKLKEHVLIGIVDNKYRLYKLNGIKLGSYAYDGEKKPDWPPGFYLEDRRGELSIAGFQGKRFVGFSLTLKDKKTDAKEWFSKKTLSKILSNLTNAILLYHVVPVGGAGKGKGDGEGDSKKGKGRRKKAEAKVNELKQRLKVLADANQAKMSGSQKDAGEQQAKDQKSGKKEGKTGEQKSDPSRQIPDRVVLWQDKNKNHWINIWTDGAHVPLKLEEGETIEQLLERVKAATEALKNARDPDLSTKLAKGVEQTGIVDEKGRPLKSEVPITDETAIPGSERKANTPAYPSEIINYGSSITVLGATNRFQMKIDYRPAGADTLSQVAARMQRINYYWELIDVTNVHPSKREEKTKSTAVGKGGHVSRGSGTGRDLARKMQNVGEDFVADVEDLASGSPAEIALTWPSRAAWLGVVGISSTVSTLGGLISSFVDIVSTPQNEQSIGFSKKGEFIIRCVATPIASEDAQIIRASSVAVSAVKVVNINERATAENEKSLKQLEQLKAEMSKLPEGEEKEALKKRIEALEKAEVANVEESGQAALSSLKKKLDVLNQLETDIRNQVPRIKRSPQVRLLDVQLQLMQIPRDDYRKQLQIQIKQVRAVLRRAKAFSRHFKGSHYRPHVTLASEENGSVTQMLMMLGEAKGSREGARRWVIADITSSKTQQVYTGKSSKAGITGHQEAIRNAFINFRENAEYGRGTIAIRLPKSLGEDLGGTITIDSHMRAAPGRKARAIKRLTDLGEAAAIAGLLITGPVGLAIGVTGGVAGAIVAVDRLSSRHSGQRLKWDFETIMDISSIIGGATAIAGAGAKALSGFPRWVSRVERVEGLLRIHGITDLGSQVIIIPLQLEMQLRQIEQMEGLSPGEKAARKAEAILHAVKSGTLTVVSAAQMLNVDPQTHQPRRTKEPTPEGAGPKAKVGVPEVEVPSVKPPKAPSEKTSKPKTSKGTKSTSQVEEGFKRRPDLEDALGDLKGKVKVIEHPTIEGTQVNYRNGELVIEIGKKQANQRQQVSWHAKIARELLRYQGPIGKIRKLISRVLDLLNITPGFGKQGFESRLEVRKLRSIIEDLQGLLYRMEAHTEKLGSSKLDATTIRKQVEAEIALYEKQLAEHQALVNSYEPGRGFIAARATTPEALMQITLGELSRDHPLSQAVSRGANIRIDDVVELHPSQIQDLKARNQLSSPPNNDLRTLLKATRTLRDVKGNRSKLSLEQQKVLDEANRTYGLRFEISDTLPDQPGLKVKTRKRSKPSKAVEPTTTSKSSKQTKPTEPTTPTESSALKDKMSSLQKQRLQLEEALKQNRAKRQELIDTHNKQRALMGEYAEKERKAPADEKASLRKKAIDARDKMLEARRQLDEELPSDVGFLKDIARIQRNIEKTDILLHPKEHRAALPCFSRDTLVWTPKGSKPIALLRIGDIVFAFDFEQNKVIQRPIVEMFRNKTQHFYDLSIGGKLISATGQHRFWVESKSTWVAARDLQVGMSLKLLHGETGTLENIILRENLESDTYNLGIEQASNYFVGPGVLVHNQGVDLGLNGNYIIYRGTNPNPKYKGKVYIGQTTLVDAKGKPRGTVKREKEHQDFAKEQLRLHKEGKIKLPPEQKDFYQFMSEVDLQPIVRGISTKDQADYLEQRNINIERQLSGEESLMNRREQIASASHMEEVLKRIKADPKVQAAGYCPK